MSEPNGKKPTRIQPEELIKGVAEGVARAVEARGKVGAALSAEEVNGVSGGATLASNALLYYRAGGRPVDPFINSLQPGDFQTIPTANTLVR